MIKMQFPKCRVTRLGWSWLRLLFIHLVGFSSATTSLAEEPRFDIPRELVLQRFSVERGGDCLLVPVRMRESNRIFLVDTGCTKTFVNEALILGKARDIAEIETPQGNLPAKVYAQPAATIGDIPIQVDDVIGIDANRIRKIREWTGHPIDGILGMDFLGHQIVHIDFDRGELSLLKSVPRDAGVMIPITWKLGESPSLDASLASNLNIHLEIDTGAITDHTGHLSSFCANSLITKYGWREIGSSTIETFLGTVSTRLIQGKQLGLGGFFVNRPTFDEVRQKSSLGLGFWSRFVVTFDFPDRKVYLRKGESYERVDSKNINGISLIKKDSRIMILDVEQGKPGSKAGFKREDELLDVGGLRSSDNSLFRMRSALREEVEMSCLVRRDNVELRMTINKKNDHQIGTKVITKYRIPLLIDGQVVDDGSTFRILTVEKLDESKLWVTADNVHGWISSDDVIPYDRAIDFFTSEILADPRNIPALKYRALLWVDKERPDLAIADYTKVIHVDRNDESTYIKRGNLSIEEEDYDSGINDYGESIRICPDDPTPRINRALALGLKKDFHNAMIDLKEAIRLDPLSSRAYRSRGALRWQDRSYGLAVEDFTHAIRLEPRDADAYDDLASLWATCPDATFRDGNRAIEYAMKACELSLWNDSEHISTLASAFAEAGKFDLAVKRQEQALELEPDDNDAARRYHKRLNLYRDKKPYRQP